MLSVSQITAGLNGPGKPVLDGGGGGQDQDNLLAFLMEKLKMTSKQVKAWSEERLKLRDAMAVYQHTDNVDPDRLQKCLENIKKAITVSSLPAMVERLEALAKPLNLKVMSTPEGNIFISSDTFYVEVRMGHNGNVEDVMVAHCKDPVSCPEMSESLKQNNFKEFGDHLSGLSEFYQTGGDVNQKAKAFSSLQCLEKDLLTIFNITKKPGYTALALVKNNLGYCSPRTGGRHMRLTYFISPYDLLDVKQQQPKELGPDDPLPKDIGLWVSVGLENSSPRKLQTTPLIVPSTNEGKVAHISSQLGPTNSIALPAVFTLTLSQPMPVSVLLLKQLQNHSGVTVVYSEHHTALPINTLICRHTLDPDFITNQQTRNMPHPRGYTFHVNLPDQKQRYFVTDSPMVGEVRGLLITKVLISQHTQALQTIRNLRQQAIYNALVASCVRKTDQENDESEEVFEVTAYNLHRMTVLFEHPAKDGMACVEFDTSDGSNPKCKLYPREGEEPFCSEEYATKVLQKCLSIPITMRAILKKTADWLETRKQKEVPAAATPAIGPRSFSSQNLPSSGPFSTHQKLNKSFSGTPGSSHSSAKTKERSSSVTQNYQGSIISDLTSSMATFFPHPQPTYSSSTAPVPQASLGETLLSPPKQTQNPMLASLLQSNMTGGGPPANRIPFNQPQSQQQPMDPPRLHQSPPVPTTNVPPPKPTKNPMLRNLLQEPNIDASFASSLQANKARKRIRKKTSDKSPQLFSDDEPGSAGHDRPANQDVFKFTVAPKLSSMPLLKESTKQLPRQSSVSSEFAKAQFDMSKQNQTLTEFSPLMNKTADQSKIVKKRPSRSDSITSVSSISTVPPSPKQSPKTPLSPAGTIPRPSRSISSTPELPAPSPSNVLPGMITEMLPRSDPLPGISQSHVLSPDFGVPPKVLSTPSHQVPSDPFDFTEDIKDIIEINVPNFDDMFLNPKTDSDEFGLSSVNSAIAKLESVSVLDNEEEKKSTVDLNPLLQRTSVTPKPPQTEPKSQSLDSPLPGIASSRLPGEVALDLSKGELPKMSTSSPAGKELRSSVSSSPTLPVQSPLPSPPQSKKTISKAHTSKGKPKDFSKSFQTDIPKPKTKRPKKNLKEPAGPAEPKKVRKRGRRKKYSDSSPECATGDDYETTVPYGQPLKMTIKLKPVEAKPKKVTPPLARIRVKTLPALSPTAGHGAEREEAHETASTAQNTAQVQPTQPRRDSDDIKRDKVELKLVEKQSKKEVSENIGIEPPEKTVKKPSDPQKVRFEERPSSKVQSSISKQLVRAGSVPKITKARTDVVKRPTYITKSDVQKPSPEDILSSVLPRGSVSSYKIPKLKKTLSQETSPKPEGDSGNIQQPDVMKKVNQSTSQSKFNEQSRLSSPKRNPTATMQRPRSASPSIRQDPNKRFENGKGSPFTKPIPGEKGGTVSSRGSVSPQSTSITKLRTSGEKSDRRGEAVPPLDAISPPSNRMSPSPQLRVPVSSGLSPNHAKSGVSAPIQTMNKSNPDITNSMHTSNFPNTSTVSHHTKTASGSTASASTKVRSASVTVSKTGSSCVQQAKAAPSTSMKSPSIPSSPSSLKTGSTVTQVKISQSPKSSPIGTTPQVKQTTKPAPLVISPNVRPPLSDVKFVTSTPSTPQTPLSAGPRMKSPTSKPRKIHSLNAIVSKLTERVQEKTTGDGTGNSEKDDDHKKFEIAQGDKEQVVRALLNSGLVEKAPLTQAKVPPQKAQTPSKQTPKEEAGKLSNAAKQGGLPLANKSTTSQTKSAVAQALKNISQPSKPDVAPSPKQSPVPTVNKASPSLPSKTAKPSSASGKSTPAKTTGSNVSSQTTKTTTVTSVPKSTPQVKISSTVSKSSVVTSSKAATVGSAKPKITTPLPGKTNQTLQSPAKNLAKTIHSPSSQRPVIISKSSTTVTSPDKGATKMTRVQIVPVSTSAVPSPTTPVVSKVTTKAQSPSVTSRPKPEKKEQDQKTNLPQGSSKDTSGNDRKSASDKGKTSGDKEEHEPDKMKEQEKLKDTEIDETEDTLKDKEDDPVSGDQLQDAEKQTPPRSDTQVESQDSGSKPTSSANDGEANGAQKNSSDSVTASAKSALKRSASKDGSNDIPKKILKVSPSPGVNLSETDEMSQTTIPLSPKSLTTMNKIPVQKSSSSVSKASGMVAKSSFSSVPRESEFKVPSPAMLPPSSPRNVIHGVRSPGPSFKPSSPTKATSPVSPGLPSPSSGEPAVGGEPTPHGVKRAATPEESALPSKRSLLLESCSPVSPAESDDGLVIDVPISPSQRKQKLSSARGKDICEASNKGLNQVKSPLPQSPLVKSPSIPVKSPAGISVGSGDAGSPCTLDDDLMNEALSSVRDDVS